MFGSRTVMSVLALSVVAGASVPAAAEPAAACTLRTDAISHLSTKYEEHPVAMGLANNGSVLEVLTTDAGSTWSILLTMPNGTTCIVAAGEHWERVSPLEVGTKL